MKNTLLAMLLFLFQMAIYAQDGVTVRGSVVDTGGQPLPGASVVVKGTTTGTQTDFDGNFTLQNVASDDVISVSYIGFVTQEVALDGRTSVSVTMEEDTQTLDEVVVVGYGTAQKRDLTGSIVSVKGGEVADKPAANPVASLQGKVSGLTVVNTGTLGGTPDVRIRGTSSRYNVSPLYVVDGIFADNINFVNPNDIESIEVLKDASSLAIFGVRGANGVIIVTTKKAKNGEFTINLNSSTGVKRISDVPDMADATLFKELYNEQLANEGAAPFSYYDVFTGDTDWVKRITNKSAMIQTYNLSLQNATEKNKLSFGLGYRSEEGLIKNEEMKRITLNLNNQYDLSDNFRMGITINGLRDKLPNTGSYSSALNATPIVDPIHYDSRPEYDGLFNQLPTEIGGPQIGNPALVAEVTKNKAIAERYRFVGSVFAEVDFLKRFTFKASVYGDYNNYRSRSYTPIVPIYVSETDEIANFNGNQLTRVNQSSSVAFNFQQDYLLSYKNDFGKHNLNTVVGFTSTDIYYEGISGSVAHDPSSTVGIIPDDERFWYLDVYPYGDSSTRVSDSDEYDRATSSFLARALYNYDSKYLLNASYRRDATSQLAPDNRAQDFWSLGAGWVATQEGFMNDLGPLSYLKVKGSMGELGNQVLPGGTNYPYYPGVDEGATAIFGDQVIAGFVQRFEENPDLKWETVKMWELGLETRWLDNRFTLNANYYNRKTEDLLVYVNTGVQTFFDNFGEISNKGFEFETSWSDNLSDDFSYSVGGNVTTIDNEVLSTFEDAPIYANGTASRTITGEPIGSFYGYIVDGIYQSNADIASLPTSTLGTYAPGDFKYRDVNGDGEITPDDRTTIGNPTPDFTYGLYVNLDYKNFYLNLDFQGVYGNEVYRNWGNGNSFAQFNYRTDRVNGWNGSGSSNWEPRLYSTDYNRFPSTYMIEDGSYFRIRNVQLGYSFDHQILEKLKVQQVKLSANFQNLYTWKNTSGFSPEAGGSPTSFGVDSGGYPLPVISTLGLSLTF
ncbi:SusC/RagA family TonB-linked outer membrane protein [Pseudozobellia thermophila]|uniref:TonB-linked outer membrane protein, SusC/RagA family n=1 Tax=Pseudozobellia thermophila TaxID=192903 RepID=A0A1M6FV73_9FLAO|nr:TonB-dependent receptor [Pseudozobellia thermophila]SHJ01597.1 TonB-linked outer membrane protein, SusC/RagA family [Pseudozobellia thermophila]